MTFNKERNMRLKMEEPITAEMMHEKIKMEVLKREDLKAAVGILDYYICSYGEEEKTLSQHALETSKFNCIINPGGSEGIYLDCRLRYYEYGMPEEIIVSTLKTLREDEEGYILLGSLAGYITKLGYEFLNINI